MNKEHDPWLRYDIAPRRATFVMGMTGCFVACLGLLTVSASAVSPPSPRTLYVATNGADSASGTSSAPLRTIASAVSRTPAGGVVVVRSGSYHETVTLQGKSHRTIKAAPGATVWLDGSRSVSNWQRSGATWVSGGWTAQFDSSPTLVAGAPDNTRSSWQFVNPAHPMAAHPDQVWIDGAAQRQVGSLAEVRPGAFYVDYPTHRMFLGSSPVGRHVLASDLSKAMSIRDPNTVISGINVRRYAPSVPMVGAVTVERPGVTLKDLQITDNATSGLQVGSGGARLSYLTLARNGMMGLRATRADGMRIDHVTVKNNNLEQFNPAPSAGGAKITRSSNVLVQNSQFNDNFGSGLWFDESVYNFQVLGSRLTDNTVNGLALEISGTAKVANNVISGNLKDGLKINDTDHVDVWNNTLTGNGRTIDIAQDARDYQGAAYRDRSLPLTLRAQWIAMRNNILAQPRSTSDCLLCVEDHSHRFSARQLHIYSNANVYQVPNQAKPRWLIVWSRGPGNPATYNSLVSLRSATAREHRGILLTQQPALNSRQKPTAAVTEQVQGNAYKVPAWVASAAHVRVGTKHFGAWIS